MTKRLIIAISILWTLLLIPSCEISIDIGTPNDPNGTNPIEWDTQTSTFTGHVLSEFRNIPIDSARVTVVMYHYNTQLPSSDYARYEYGDADSSGRFELTFLTNGYLCEIHAAAPGFWYYKLDFSPDCNHQDHYVPFEERMPDTIFMHPL